MPWEKPDKTLEDLMQLAVFIMNLGSMEDWEELIAILGEDYLRRTLRESPAILFAEKAWFYWHRRLFGCDTKVPEMPKRSKLDSKI